MRACAFYSIFYQNIKVEILSSQFGSRPKHHYTFVWSEGEFKLLVRQAQDIAREIGETLTIEVIFPSRKLIEARRETTSTNNIVYIEIMIRIRRDLDDNLALSTPFQKRKALNHARTTPEFSDKFISRPPLLRLFRSQELLLSQIDRHASSITIRLPQCLLCLIRRPPFPLQSLLKPTRTAQAG